MEATRSGPSIVCASSSSSPNGTDTIGRAGTKFILTWRALNRSMIGERDISRRSRDPTVAGATSKAPRRSIAQMGKGKSGATFCEVLIAILLPPLGVFLKYDCGLEFWICLLLTILGYIPGILYALYVIVA